MTGFRMAWAAMLAGLGLALAAGPAAAEFRQIAGTAEYGERTALPSDATLEIQLLELQGGETAPVPIASISIRVLGASPFPFELTFDDAMISPERPYALAARIQRAGETLFRAAEATPMFSGLASGPPVIRLVRAEPAGGPAEPRLEGSEWVLSGMETGEITQSSPARLGFGTENDLKGTGGCNDFQASYRVDPPTGLSFGKLAATLRGCTAGLAQQERLVFRALGRTKAYEIDEAGELVLYEADGKALLRFKQLR